MEAGSRWGTCSVPVWIPRSTNCLPWSLFPVKRLGWLLHCHNESSDPDLRAASTWQQMPYGCPDRHLPRQDKAGLWWDADIFHAGVWWNFHPSLTRWVKPVPKRGDGNGWPTAGYICCFIRAAAELSCTLPTLLLAQRKDQRAPGTGKGKRIKVESDGEQGKIKNWVSFKNILLDLNVLLKCKVLIALRYQIPPLLPAFAHPFASGQITCIPSTLSFQRVCTQTMLHSNYRQFGMERIVKQGGKQCAQDHSPWRSTRAGESYPIVIHAVGSAFRHVRLLKVLQLLNKGLAELLCEHWESKDPLICQEKGQRLLGKIIGKSSWLLCFLARLCSCWWECSTHTFHFVLWLLKELAVFLRISSGMDLLFSMLTLCFQASPSSCETWHWFKCLL